jgi:hypothetical protein
MGVVHVGDKPITLPDEIIDAGIETIRAALAVEIPDIENAEITIDKPTSAAVVTDRKSATVVRRATPKG